MGKMTNFDLILIILVLKCQLEKKFKISFRTPERTTSLFYSFNVILYTTCSSVNTTHINQIPTNTRALHFIHPLNGKWYFTTLSVLTRKPEQDNPDEPHRPITAQIFRHLYLPDLDLDHNHSMLTTSFPFRKGAW